MRLRESDPQGFAEAMLEAHLKEYERHSGGAGPVVFDRGLPDVVGFLKVGGLAVPAHLDRACRTVRYRGPILRAPAWEAIYQPDAERIQNWEEAVASDLACTAAWREYGYEPVNLPLAPVEERLKFLDKILRG